MEKIHEYSDNEYANVNDNYKIRDDYAALIQHCKEFEINIQRFLGPVKSKHAGTKAKAELRTIRSLAIAIGKKIQKKREDYDSDYEG